MEENKKIEESQAESQDIRLMIKIKNTSSPHLFLDQIKLMIKDDEYLLPQMRKTLNLLKKFKRSYIQLPLQMEVIVSPLNKCNLERALSPTLLNFNKTDWDEKDVAKWSKDKKKFEEDVISLYEKMGYNVERLPPPSKEGVENIIEEINKKETKFGGNLLTKLK